MTKWLVANTKSVWNGKLEYQIQERPLLHACCANDHFGDVNIDIRPEVNPDKVCDVTKELPFEENQFEAGFMDTPWIEKWRWDCAKAIKQMLRVCKIVYVLSPWLYGAKTCYPEEIHISWRPGINHPILFVKYRKRNILGEM